MTKKLAAWILIVATSALFAGCKEESDKPEVWIYTSLYKDTIADIQPILEKKFPDVKFNFFQAGSEDIASKISAEEMAGGTKADIVIASDPFWYEEMANKGKFVAYKPANTTLVPQALSHPAGLYTTVSFPLMVMAYNSEAVPEAQAPKTFKEMADAKWKGKFTTGSPLASGTNFATVAILQDKYGWDYFKGLRKNDTISEGGNSSVLRRVQTKERPVGWVLLENVLRFQTTDKNLKILLPDDGAVLQFNILAIVNKKTSREPAQKFSDWLFSKEGQEAMTRSYMYSVVPGFEAPKGAPPFAQVIANTKPWTADLLQRLMKDRDSIKEQFTKIMFQ